MQAPTDNPNRDSFAEKHFKDRRGTPWLVREYQRNSLNSTALRKIHRDGRDVGKTTEIEITALWFLLHHPGQEMLIATQTENHLDPLMQRIHRRIESTPALRTHLVESRRSPSWFFRFDNGAMLWGRIAGPRGINFQGMHADFQIIDEAQEMTDTAWGELYQALNGGGTRWVYGVPNGLRNTFYRMSEQKDIEAHHWESQLNPEFTPEKDTELQHLYGGPESPGYLHRVKGEHGAPAHAVFNLDDYLACIDDTLPFLHLTAQGTTPLKQIPPDPLSPSTPRPTSPNCPTSPTSPHSPLSIFNCPLPADYYLGCDLGFARDPSEFVLYQSTPPHLVNIARIHLQGVNYARQTQLIQDLDAAYNFLGIGIDAGNSGRAVAHQLMQLGPHWCDKIRAYEFGGTTELAPLPDGTKPKRRTKELMTELLVQRMCERSIVFPRLPDRETQYASHTYEVNTYGQILYQKGNDHIIDADRCALLRHHQDTTEPTRFFSPYGNRSPLLFTF